MNALELANNLDKYYDFKKQFPQTADDVIAMLRQQQAEIESLKKQVLGDNYVFVCKRCGEEMGINYVESEK